MMKRNSFNLTISLCVLLSLSLSCSQKTNKKSDMVLIPAGEFWMGSTEKELSTACEENDKARNRGSGYRSCEINKFENEMPKHKVYLDAYFIDKYEVTNAQYKDCVNTGQCSKPRDTTWYDNKTYVNHPVIYVDWMQANAYCTWSGKRLPTEAEWEKASRGKTGNIWTWGNSWDENKSNNVSNVGLLRSQVANMFRDKGTVPVGSFSEDVSSYGVYDMAGNVREWVSDWYEETYYKSSPDKNPKGPTNGQFKVIRGGSWANGTYYLRGALRSWLDPGNSFNYINGFRCAKSAE